MTRSTRGGSGGIDGAHILTPMPYLMATGKIVQNGQKLPMAILARLDTNGRKLTASPLRMKFTADHASYPFQSHELWFLTEDQRWGILPPDLATAPLITETNREDIWRDAAKLAGVTDVPAGKSRGVETFFDGKKFDPAKPADYLASLVIKKLTA